jgi:chromosomal replication initiator protein
LRVLPRPLDLGTNIAIWRTSLLSVDTSAQRVWEATLGRLQLQVTRPSFDTWLRGTVGVDLADRQLVVGVPTTFVAEWLEQRMCHLIEAAVETVAQEPLAVRFQVHQAQPAAALPDSPKANEAPRPATQQTRNGSSLNHRYTFSSFVVGGSSQLAHAAAMAVSDHPGEQYNPLFIYSPVGLGKTHLLHAIAHRARAQGKTAHYISTEEFTHEFITAIRDRTTTEFRARHRSVDILLIDDIQFISGKEQTQEGFFHTFNALHNANRQVVITCDRPPASLVLLEDRLVSRFEWGLIAAIQAPDPETRLAILRHQSQDAPVELSDSVLALIAQLSPASVRQLQGNLTRVVAMSHFTQQPASQELVMDLLGPASPDGSSPAGPTAHQIIDHVARHYQLPPDSLSSPRRDKKTSAARQVAMYILTKLLYLAPADVGLLLGPRDRTTVLYSLRKLSSQLVSDSSLAKDLALLTTELRR